MTRDQQYPAFDSALREQGRAGLRRLERDLRERLSALLGWVKGKERFLLELRIREVAQNAWSIGELLAISVKGRRSYQRYRQQMRDMLRPLGADDDDSVDEMLSLIWPRRGYRKGCSKRRRRKGGRDD